jgi:hypothetical protein
MHKRKQQIPPAPRLLLQALNFSSKDALVGVLLNLKPHPHRRLLLSLLRMLGLKL